jgi:quercetin dioxygenase-like cupin family protein
MSNSKSKGPGRSMDSRLIPKVVAHHEGEDITVTGDTGRIIIRGEDTNGAFCVCELESPPNVGPPYHVHSREDETFYVIEGEFMFWLGDATRRVKAGDVVYAARDTAHTFQCVGDTPGKMVLFIAPAGFEKFFIYAADLNKRGEFSPEKLTKAAAEYGCTILGPPPAP